MPDTDRCRTNGDTLHITTSPAVDATVAVPSKWVLAAGIGYRVTYTAPVQPIHDPSPERASSLNRNMTMTDNPETADIEAAEQPDRAILVDRACQSMTRLVDVLDDIIGNDNTPPVGTMRPEQFGGETGDAYRLRHRQLIDAARRVRELSVVQMIRLRALRSELDDAEPDALLRTADAEVDDLNGGLR